MYDPFASRALLLTTCITAGTLFAGPAATAQEADQRLVTKVYNVSDLVLPVPDYSFRGVMLPGLDSDGAGRYGRPAASPIGGLGGGLGGGGGGLGGGGGGGIFQFGGGFGGGLGTAASGGNIPQATGQVFATPDTQPLSLRFTMHDLMAAVERLIETNSWDSVGGIGSITPLGGLLLVAQTADCHQKVAALLDSLRKEGIAVRSITVKAHWLMLSSEQLASIVDDGTIERTELDTMAATHGARAQITCLDGQSVHIVSGRIKSSVSSVIPVVGSVDHDTPQRQLAQGGSAGRPESALAAQSQRPGSPEIPPGILAQVASTPQRSLDSDAVSGGGFGSRTAGVGYMPQIQTINLGALLELTPSVVTGTQSVVVDIRSVVTAAPDPAVPTAVVKHATPLDKLNVVAQQFMTTLRIPMGKPALIGGATLLPADLPTRDEQLYLFLDVATAAID